MFLHDTDVDVDRAASICGEVVKELIRATSLNGPMHSAHEAYAVILEELDEYKEWVWLKAKLRDPAAMRKELIQIAAMAIRAIMDTIPESHGNNTNT